MAKPLGQISIPTTAKGEFKSCADFTSSEGSLRGRSPLIFILLPLPQRGRGTKGDGAIFVEQMDEADKRIARCH
jgi:hypothetical protein